ncbi:MAG TPA: ATP-grasp domain-containing protein [Pirellulales bacterium]|nr:ATP-grasp domain-containing protein [Pirellulales bacterium]
MTSTNSSTITIAVSGLNAGENPQPGPGIIRSLRRRFDNVRIVGLCYDVMESGIYVAGGPDVVYRLPFPSIGSTALLARLEDVLAEQPIDIFIPTLDTELHGVLKLENELAARGVRMLLPRLEALRACRKSELPALARRSNCKTPTSINVVDESGLLAAATEIGYPLMVKGPFYGAYRVHDERTLIDRFASIIASWGGPAVVQECVEGGEFNVMAVGDGEGAASGLCAVRKTILSDRGKGFGGITVCDENLNDTAIALIRELKWRGPLELEFIRDDRTESFYLIEINPRFPAWVDFPSTFGHNLPALVVEQLAQGRMSHLPDCPTGKFFIRHAVDLMGDIAQLGELSMTGRLRPTDFEPAPAPPPNSIAAPYTTTPSLTPAAVFSPLPSSSPSSPVRLPASA